MSRYDIDRWMDNCASMSREDIEDAAYEAVKVLYYGYAKTVNNDLASDLLYTTAAVTILNSGCSELTTKVYNLLSSAFGVRLSQNEFLNSLIKHDTDSKRQAMLKAMQSFNQKEHEALVTFACAIFTCDGQITRGEREFMYGFFE